MSSSTLIEKCCLLACPVAGKPTHFVVEQAFLLAGLDWRFMSFEVDPQHLGDAMRGIRALGFHGVTVAEPHHAAVIEYLDELTDRARLSGSVNCVTADGARLLGDDTEGLALVNLVRPHLDLAGQQVVLIGSGRLARVIAVALAQAGAASIAVASRSGEAGQRLVEFIDYETSAAASLVEFSDRQPIKVPAGVKLLVNASPQGTANPSAALPIELAAQPAGGVVVDVSFGSPGTWLTREAAKRGCTVVDGVELYVEQTALALATWTGVDPDKTAIREAVEEFLGI